MLKDVRFDRFDTRPDLLAHLQGLLPDLEQEIGRWVYRVEVVFELRQPGLDRRPFVWLTLSLTLSQSAAVSSAVAAFEDIERAADFRKWVRHLWGELLDKLLDQRARASELEASQPSGG